MTKKVLVCIELDEASAHCVLSRAQSILGPEAEVHSLFVVDPTTVHYVADPSMMGRGYEQTYLETMEKARTRLIGLCDGYGIVPDRCHVRYGRVAQQVHEFAAVEGFDQIMIGSHGWSGWQRLLGSHAASILHGAPLDVWVIKVDERDEEIR